MTDHDDSTPHQRSVLVLDPADDGVRLDVVVGRRMEGLSRRMARQRGLAGDLSIDGRRAAPSDRVRIGTRITLRLDPAATTPPAAVEVLAVTSRFVYVDKPTGMHTQRLRPDDPPTLADAVARLHPECALAGPSAREGGAVHRLDHGTSGVVCFARGPEAWQLARDAFAAGVVDKTYVARIASPLPAVVPLVSAGSVRRLHSPAPSLVGIVVGSTSAEGFCVDAPLGPQSGAAGVRRVQLSPQGRDALTEVWGIEQPGEPASPLPPWMVVLSLRTGHRHQARVHLAALGCPIVDDPLYDAAAGDEPAGIGPRAHRGLLLHAGSLDFGAAIPGEARVVAALHQRFWVSA